MMFSTRPFMVCVLLAVAGCTRPKSLPPVASDTATAPASVKAGPFGMHDRIAARIRTQRHAEDSGAMGFDPIAIAADGKTLAFVVSTSNDNIITSHVEIYRSMQGTGTWKLAESIAAPHAATRRFGMSIAIATTQEGQTLVVDAVEEEDSKRDARFLRKAYVYTLSAQANARLESTVDLKSEGLFVAETWKPRALALSGDGKVLAFATEARERNGYLDEGPTLMFARKDQTWLTAGQTAKQPTSALALSKDGSVLIAGDALHHRAFRYVANPQSAWKLDTELKPTGSGLGFGTGVAVSSDGLIAAIGAPFEGVDKLVRNEDGSERHDNVSFFSGSVYVYEAGALKQKIRASNARPLANFGASVALTENGKTLAIASPGESSAAIGIDAKGSWLHKGPEDDTALDTGAVYIYTGSEGTWTEAHYIKPPEAHALVCPAASEQNAPAPATRGPHGEGCIPQLKGSPRCSNILFGSAVALSRGGSTVAIFAPGEQGGAAESEGVLHIYR
jgi:hypothetical protein